MVRKNIIGLLAILLVCAVFIRMDDKLYPYFYGRLYVSDVGIDVALYYDASQTVVDRLDSATIFKLAPNDGLNIGDHNGQEFRKLFRVKVGMDGYIRLESGDVVNIRCTDVFNGHNIRSAITDENGIIVSGRSDILMYTCRDSSENVLICLWEIIEN